MYRCFVPLVRALRPKTALVNAARILTGNNSNNYATLSSNFAKLSLNSSYKSSMLNNEQILNVYSNIAPVPIRTVTKFSLKKGKRKTVKAVLRRFFRLEWGAWIRPKVGRNKKIWTKSVKQRRRLRQHVFCNATQTTLLDKMVTKYWKKPKYFVDDPYAPYHTREEFGMTRKKPL